MKWKNANKEQLDNRSKQQQQQNKVNTHTNKRKTKKRANKTTKTRTAHEPGNFKAQVMELLLEGRVATRNFGVVEADLESEVRRRLHLRLRPRLDLFFQDIL